MSTISDNSRNVLVALLCLIIKCHRPNVMIKLRATSPLPLPFLTFKTNPKKSFSPGKNTYFKPKLNFSPVSLNPAFSKAGKQGFPELTKMILEKMTKSPRRVSFHRPADNANPSLSCSFGSGQYLSGRTPSAGPHAVGGTKTSGSGGWLSLLDCQQLSSHITLGSFFLFPAEN